jgi:hypothetical protein
MRFLIALTAVALCAAGCQTTGSTAAAAEDEYAAERAEAEAMRRSNTLMITCNPAGEVVYTLNDQVVAGTTSHPCERGMPLPVLARAHNFDGGEGSQLLLIEGPIPGFPNYGAIIRVRPGAAPVLVEIGSLESFGEVRGPDRLVYRHGGLNPSGGVYLITSELTFDWSGGGRIASERELSIEGSRN